MFYSENFKAQVREEFPDNEEILAKLDNGDATLLMDLGDEAFNSIPLEIVLGAESLEELQNLARSMQKKLNLYYECCKVSTDDAETANDDAETANAE